MQTKQEYLAAAKVLGLKGLSMNSNLDELRSAVNAVLGLPDLTPTDQSNQQTDQVATIIAKHGHEAIARPTGPVVAPFGNIPNLAPTGIWEGKRARIRRVKTGHNDMGGAPFNWNGYHCIVPIDAPVDIPWPILGIIQNCKGMDMTITQEEDKGKVFNRKNKTYFDKYPYQFLGVTPGTEHLPESPWEYTLDQYVDGFPGFTVRMWRQLCILWEISDEQANIKSGVSPEQEIVARRNAIHFQLNLPMEAEARVRERIRDEKRRDIGMAA